MRIMNLFLPLMSDRQRIERYLKKIVGDGYVKVYDIKGDKAIYSLFICGYLNSIEWEDQIAEEKRRKLINGRTINGGFVCDVIPTIKTIPPFRECPDDLVYAVLRDWDRIKKECHEGRRELL